MNGTERNVSPNQDDALNDSWFRVRAVRRARRVEALERHFAARTIAGGYRRRREPDPELDGSWFR